MSEFLSNPENSKLIMWLFWGALLAGAALYLLMSSIRRHSAPGKRMAVENNRFVKAAAAEEELMVKTVRVVGPGTSYVPLKRSRTEPSVLKKPPYVEFKAHNREHCLAIKSLMGNPARQHPTLRFDFDPKLHGSAYDHALAAIMDYHVERMTRVRSRALQPQVVTETAAPDNLIQLSAPLRQKGSA